MKPNISSFGKIIGADEKLGIYEIISVDKNIGVDRKIGAGKN
jgi:hypothetical protein